MTKDEPRFSCLWCKDEMPVKYLETHNRVCARVRAMAQALVRGLTYELFGISDDGER